MLKSITPIFLLLSLSFSAHAKELAGVVVEDTVTMSNGETLTLNGMGLREKLWIDVYVGSLFLVRPVNNVAEVLSLPNALRIQMDFVYKEVSSEKLIKAWKKGFEKNQSEQKLKVLQSRIERFYSFFEESAKKHDRYIIDYLPEQGSSISKNGALIGSIEGVDFKDAMIEIWLGNYPADKGLKQGMLGLK